MESIKPQKLCECGCGMPAPIATRNWHKRGIKKGQSLRFVCGHHRRGQEQSREEKLKRVKRWTSEKADFSPYLPGNRIIKFFPLQKRWYCSQYGTNSKKTHARAVYEHFFGPVKKGWAVHHKNGSAEKIEDDKPENLIAIPKIWNLHYLPWLAQGFEVKEEIVTNYYLFAIEKFPEKQVFKEVCRLLIEKTND